MSLIFQPASASLSLLYFRKLLSFSHQFSLPSSNLYQWEWRHCAPPPIKSAFLGLIQSVAGHRQTSALMYCTRQSWAHGTVLTQQTSIIFRESCTDELASDETDKLCIFFILAIWISVARFAAKIKAFMAYELLMLNNVSSSIHLVPKLLV